MEVLVCVKRVPMVGGTVVVTPDGQDVDTRMSGFAVSPHEECAVEEAVRIVERLGGSVTVLTLGPPGAADQLRDMLALGAGHALLLETDGREWGPIATAAAISAAAISAAAVRRAEGAGRGDGGDGGDRGDRGFDLLLFGHEAADTGDYQVPVRVAHALGLPCVTGIKALEIIAADPDPNPNPGSGSGAGPNPGPGSGSRAGSGSAAPFHDHGLDPASFGGKPPTIMSAGASGPPRSGAGARLRARRENRGVEETFAVTLPAVVSVKEGINLPRYPSLPGRLRAKRAVIERFVPEWHGEGLRKERLRVPAGERKRAQILGAGPDAVPALVRLLDELGVLR